jgi:hypothetical protein
MTTKSDPKASAFAIPFTPELAQALRHVRYHMQYVTRSGDVTVEAAELKVILETLEAALELKAE